MQDLSIVQARILAGQKDKRRRDLTRLSRSSDLRLFPEPFHLLIWSARGLQRRVYWSRPIPTVSHHLPISGTSDLRNSIHPNPLADDILLQRPREAYNRRLGSRIIDHRPRPPERHHTRGINNTRALLHVLQRLLRQHHHLYDIRPKHALNLRDFYIREILDLRLLRRVVDENIQLAVCVNVLFDDAVDVVELLEVEGDAETLPACGFDETLGF